MKKTLALLAATLSRRLSDSATLVFIATALALMAPHLLARPHVMAMPVMVLWIGGVIDAADRHEAPSFWLLPLIALWANLHGGFVFGVFFAGTVALDCIVGAEARARKALVLRWGAFGLAAVAAACLLSGWP